MLNIVLFGPPGSGKGTQSEKIIERYRLMHFSTGDMLRAELAAETELGLRAKSIMERGELVSDEIIIGMIRNRISGETDTYDTVDSNKNGLEPSDYFTTVTISSAKKDRTGDRVRFEMKLQKAK